jgi:hypothetical protein
MGEVYRARDPRLRREVAIKVLPSALASDLDRLSRFEREARAASALSHPNIVTVYDVGTENSTAYIVVELIDGKTLRDLLLPGPLPIRKLLEIAVQIADGLAAAHESGIVHRDLKPRNVMVTRAGLVKILDFGLAKFSEAPTAAPATSMSETVTEAGTSPGVLLGTTEYMSPEQARGQPLDFRTDQFSLGTLLYEMATGRHAFARSTPVDTLTAILQQEPTPVQQLNPEVPAPLRWTIERCLAKSAPDRYASTRDLARELQAMREHISEISGEQRPMAVSAPSPRRKWAIAGAAIAAAAIAVAVFGFGLSRLSRRGRIPEFRRLTFRNGLVTRALFVPRSNGILYTASWDGGPLGTFLTLPEAKGADRRIEAPAQLPMAYTADGSQVLVLLGSSRARLNPIGRLAWWPALGGQPRPLLDGAGWSDWARSGRFIVVVRTVGDQRVLEIHPESGGQPRSLFRTAGAVSWVRISPDERRVAFFHHRSRFDDSGEVRIVSTDGSGSRAITPRFESCAGLAWNDATGEVWFTAAKESIYSTALWGATPAGRLKRIYSFPAFLQLQDVSGGQCLLTGESGDTKMLVQRAGEPPKELSWLGSSMITDLSHDGKNLLFIDGTGDQSSPGTWIRSVEGGEAVKVADGEFAAFSPDDQSVVTTTPARTSPAQVLIVSVSSGSARTLTSSNAVHSFPTFLGPETVLFGRVANGKNEIWEVPARGGEERLVVAGCDKAAGSPSGREMLCIGGERDNVLFAAAYGAGVKPVLRRVHELPPGARFVHARWSSTGDRIYVVTTLRRLLTVDAARGTLLADQPVLPGESIGADSLLGAAVNGDATLQAFSVSHLGSQLYLFRGL